MDNSDLLQKMKRLERRFGRGEYKSPGINWGGAVLPVPPEGSFTPTYFGSATAGVTTYVIQQGAYGRIGPLVFFTLTLQWSAATGTGQVRIGGLPFTVSSVSNQNFTPTVYHSGVTFPNSGIIALLTPGATSIRLFSPVTNAANAELAIETAGTLVLSGFYYV